MTPDFLQLFNKLSSWSLGELTEGYYSSKNPRNDLRGFPAFDLIAVLLSAAPRAETLWVRPWRFSWVSARV